MRTFYIAVTFPHKGSKYPISATHRVKASGLTPAVGQALRDTKKKYKGRFRVAEGGTFTISVTVGPSDQNHDSNPPSEGAPPCASNSA